MKKAFLIYNPASGRRRKKRTQDIARVEEVLRTAGVEVETCATTHLGSAIEQVQAMLAPEDLDESERPVPAAYLP